MVIKRVRKNGDCDLVGNVAAVSRIFDKNINSVALCIRYPNSVDEDELPIGEDEVAFIMNDEGKTIEKFLPK